MSDSSPHIAHIMPWASVGGTEHATLRIARETAAHGIRSTMFCYEAATEVREFFYNAGFDTAIYQAVEPSLSRPAKYINAARELAREMRRRGVNIMHCADILAAHYASLAGRFARLPVICHVRNRHRDISRRDKLFLSPVNNWIFVSKDTWRGFGVNVPAHRGEVVYDGIDAPQVTGEDRESVRREFGIAAHEKIIGMVARVAPQKDYVTLARAAQKVLAVFPNARFVVAGDYDGVPAHRTHYEEIKHLLDEYKIGDRFIFTGFRRDIPRVIAAMDVFVLCTHHEGLPLVLLEGMAQGLPTLATAVDGIPELITDEANGLLHAHGDDAKLAEHLLKVLDDKAFAKRIGDNARAHVAANFSNERFASNMQNAYRSLLRG